MTVAYPFCRWTPQAHSLEVCDSDGFSRMVVYLKNNRAATVYNLFLQAVRRFSLPSRIRSDEGGLVALHMIRHRGAERRSMIVGSSVHNQCIERLLRDLFQSTIRLYYRLFYFLEAKGHLDPVNGIHLYYVYLPLIGTVSRWLEPSWDTYSKQQVPLPDFYSWSLATPG